MRLSRRRFLSASGTVLAIPVIRGSHPEAQLTTTQEATMEITRVGSPPSEPEQREHFTGPVRIDRLGKAGTHITVVGFEPGSRTAWHTHPLGQTLIITSGCGWVQQEGNPIEEVHPGDGIWIPENKRHWHGATPETPMTHIAIHEELNGKDVVWQEPVSDDQYRR
jgi:quercetin dioxygenase-like cupin family protein